ncbi:MAG: response regulator [Balneolales bacterium]
MNILVTDDEFIIAQNIRMQLERKGYNVSIGITTFEEIIIAVKEGNFDLIITKINMYTESNGIDLVTEIRTFSSIPVIYLTSITDKKIRERAEKTSPCDYIIKPVDNEELCNRIEQCLKKAGVFQMHF